MDKAAEKKAKDKAKRLETKFARVQAGVDELNIWLRDLIRAGLMGLPERPKSYFDTAAARMVDAQASGMAAMVRQLRDLDYGQEGWQEMAAEITGQIWMAIRAFPGRDALPELLRADLLAVMGLGPGPKEVMTSEPGNHLADQWLVLGIQTELNDDITTQRNWLYGVHSATFALVLQFAYKKMPLEDIFQKGKIYDATLSFFPSAAPLRATIKEKGAVITKSPETDWEWQDWASAQETIAERVTANPWIDRFPLTVTGLTPWVKEGKKGLVTSDGKWVPLLDSTPFPLFLQCLSISGGDPLSLFLLRSNKGLEILGVMSDGKYLGI